jgi:ketosteroid isomerase-like protein
MYHAIVRHRIRGAFDRLSQGEWEASLGDISPDVHHVFPGDHPLGGERHSREAMELWFARLFRLFPDIRFEVHDVIAKGWPWNTRVTVQWSDAGTTADGEHYVNHGTHWFRLRWGKGVDVRAYLDTAVVEETCRRMAAAGIEEAAAEPITS